MSDVADDLGLEVDELLRMSKTGPLRDQMQEFVDTHAVADDLRTLRKDVSNGDNLSDLGIEQRNERV